MQSFGSSLSLAVALALLVLAAVPSVTLGSAARPNIKCRDSTFAYRTLGTHDTGKSFEFYTLGGSFGLYWKGTFGESFRDPTPMIGASGYYVHLPKDACKTGDEFTYDCSAVANETHFVRVYAVRDIEDVLAPDGFGQRTIQPVVLDSFHLKQTHKHLTITYARGEEQASSTTAWRFCAKDNSTDSAIPKEVYQYEKRVEPPS